MALTICKPDPVSNRTLTVKQLAEHLAPFVKDSPDRLVIIGLQPVDEPAEPESWRLLKPTGTVFLVDLPGCLAIGRIDPKEYP